MKRVLSFFRVDDDNPLNGWHVLGIVGLFFGTIIAVNIVMAVFATGTFPGLVVKNSYVASQNFNELLAAGKAQEERGWTADVSTDDGLLQVRLEDSGGAPITGLRVSARAGRPASIREDRILALRLTSNGYVAADALPPGRWIVELAVRSGEDLVYRATRPLLVGGGGT